MPGGVGGVASGQLVRLVHGRYTEIQELDTCTALFDFAGNVTRVERRAFIGKLPAFEWITPDDRFVTCTADTRIHNPDGRKLTPYELGWELLDVKHVPVYQLKCTPHNSFRLLVNIPIVGLNG